MSRSRKHSSIRGVSSSASEKKDKRLANRTLRHHNKILVKKSQDEALPLEMNQVMTKWGYGKRRENLF